MEIGIVVLILVVGAVAVYFVRRYVNGPGELKDEIVKSFVGIGVDKKFWTPHHSYTTPGGIKVESADPIPPHALQEIENGISNQIRLYTEQNPKWTAGKTLAEYPVMVIKQMGVNSDGSPHMHVKGWWSAGTMFGGNERWEILDKKPIVVIVSQHEQDWRFLEYFRHSAHAESEHLREWLCRNMEPTGRFHYWAHSADQHPHTGSWGDVVGLKGSSPLECVFPEVGPKK